MKVAQIDVNYNFSSTGKIVADLVAGLQGLGHDAMALYGRGPQASQANAHRISTTPEVYFHALCTRVSGLTDGFSPMATRRAIANLEAFAPDVVHLHDIHGYFVNIGELVDYLQRRRIPTAWTFHCEFMYTGKCGYSFDCNKWQTECGACPDLRGYPESWFFDFTARMHRQKRTMFANFERLHLAAPSRWLADRMAQSMVRDKPISVVSNGLNLDVFHPRDTAALKAQLGLTDEYVVLSVGSDLMSELKGGRWVLELARRCTDPSVVFIMVGADRMSENVPANVRVIPRVYDQALLASYYALADILLLTSNKETFSMVSAESLACGTPVIGFDSGAPTEVAAPGFGLFVPYGDLPALEALLGQARRQELTLMPPQACTQFARDRYAKEVMVRAYADIYQQLLTRHAGRQ